MTIKSGSTTLNALHGKFSMTSRPIPLLLLTLSLMMSACASKKTLVKPTGTDESPSTDSGGFRGIRTDSLLKRRILQLALQEWEFFGGQQVRLEGAEESIPHVGKWEDDGEPYASRVNRYWRAVGKPQLDGNDCRQPWSAAFISWVMQEAGVSRYDFPPSDAHWDYIHSIMDNPPTASFVAHGIRDYSPQAGDLICATRGNAGFIPVYDAMSTGAVLRGHTKLHCDIVVERQGKQLAAIGGNVRNSVSKTIIDLNRNNLIQPTERRPWFVILENRLTQ